MPLMYPHQDSPCNTSSRDTSSLYRRLPYRRFITSLACFTICIFSFPHSPWVGRSSHPLFSVNGPLTATAQPGVSPTKEKIELPQDTADDAKVPFHIIVAFDVDETLLSTGDVVANPQTKDVLDALLEESRINSYLHSMVIFSNGFDTEGKFKSAGLPDLEKYFKHVFELDFAMTNNPVLKQKDLSLLRDEIFEREETPELANDAIIVLVDDLGDRYKRFNICNKEHKRVISVQVDAFKPGDENASPSGFGLRKFLEVLLNFLHSSNLRSFSANQATEVLSKQFAAAMERNLHVSPSRKAVPFPHLKKHPMGDCPFETKLVKRAGAEKDVIYPLLVTDARWIWDFVVTSEKARNEAMDEIAVALRAIAAYTSALYVHCADEGGKGCDSLKTSLEKALSSKDVHVPIVFSKDLRNEMNRSTDMLPLLRASLSLSDHRTLNIVFDVRKKLALDQSNVGFFESDVKEISAWRCQDEQTYSHENQYQFILKWDNLQAFMYLLGVMLRHVTSPSEISSDRHGLSPTPTPRPDLDGFLQPPERFSPRVFGPQIAEPKPQRERRHSAPTGSMRHTSKRGSASSSFKRHTSKRGSASSSFKRHTSKRRSTSSTSRRHSAPPASRRDSAPSATVEERMDDFAKMVKNLFKQNSFEVHAKCRKVSIAYNEVYFLL